jgi:hypothetical protein
VIAHLVLFRPRPDLGAQARAALVDALATAFQEIPTIRRARVGRRVTTGRPYEALMRADYSHAAILEFDDQAGLMAYFDHPAHAALASRFFEAFDEALLYDFVLEEGAAGIELVRAG